jgi:hypothetical protein
LILVVTLDALRADAVGFTGGPPGLTPNLDRLAHQASWAGPAVASGSWTVPAMASIWTGLAPWQHGAIHPLQARLDASLVTLPEVMRAAGYRTFAFRDNSWLTGAYGWDQGFDVVGRSRNLNAALELLRAPPPGPLFVWVHLSEALPPYEGETSGPARAPASEAGNGHRRRRPAAGGTSAGPAGAEKDGPSAARALPPERLREGELERWADPAAALPAAERTRIVDLYRQDVHRADGMVGHLLAAVVTGGRDAAATVVVVGTTGVALGEAGAGVGAGMALSRSVLEVPLAVRLPSTATAGGGALVGGPGVGEAVGTSRLWATLVQLVGGTPTPATAPSLARSDPGGVLSERYLGAGDNLFSLVVGSAAAADDDGFVQVLWQSRFAPPQADFYGPAFGHLRATSQAPAEVGGAVGVQVDAPVLRLLRSFERVPPLSGLGTPTLSLERWPGSGGEMPVDDPERLATLSRDLEIRWRSFLGGERSAGDEARAKRRDARLGILPTSRPAGYP